MGGSPVIAGTRIRVSDIVRYREMWPDLSSIVRQLPHLTLEQVNAALAYYDSHRAEIDNEIETEAALAKEWRPNRAST